jgi:hypothetical protein
MVVQEVNLEMSLSSFTADDNPIGKGNDTERMWNSMSVNDSPSYSNPDEDRKKRVSFPIQHKQRGHARPDVWVGQKSTRRSWKVKSATDVADSSPPKEESEEKDNESQDTLSILHSLSVKLQEQAEGEPSFSKFSKDHDSKHGDTKKVPVFGLPVKEKEVRGFDSSMHKQRGHARPDVWVGQKSTRRSWKVKSTNDVADNSPPN